MGILHHSKAYTRRACETADASDRRETAIRVYSQTIQLCFFRTPYRCSKSYEPIEQQSNILGFVSAASVHLFTFDNGAVGCDA